MENHILWFFLWFWILQYFTAFDIILHQGGFYKPFSFGHWISYLSFNSYQKYTKSINRLEGRRAVDAAGAGLNGLTGTIKAKW